MIGHELLLYLVSAIRALEGNQVGVWSAKCFDNFMQTVGPELAAHEGQRSRQNRVLFSVVCLSSCYPGDQVEFRYQ